ncbi:E3 ubiquitin-protein ligase RNF26 [Discoglossus pictus]
MQGLLMVLSGLGWTLELLLFILDLNYWLVSSLVSLIFWTVCFIFSLPGLLSMGLVHFWEGMLGSMARMGESCCSLVFAIIQIAGDAVRGGLAGLDSLKLVWNLMSHLLLRSREMVHRGVLNIGTSGQTINRQFWEALGIAGSLAAYLANSLVNICLIAVQNVLSLALVLWFSLANVFLTGMELVVDLLSQISNSAVAVVILLWTPCQLALDGLTTLSRGLGIIFFRNLYEVLLLLFLIWISRVLSRQTPAFRQFRRRAERLYHVILIGGHALLNSDIWRRVAARSIQLIRRYRAGWERDLRTRAQNPPQRVPLRVPLGQNQPARVPLGQNQPARVPLGQNQPARVPLGQNQPARVPLGQNQPAQVPLGQNQPAPQNPCPAAPVPEHNPEPSDEGEMVSQDPWKLLKQQEESKKCVICQDETKTVLLLPCRHLCLCAACNQILLQQPILQRNCPLCRQMILQTLNVYI